MSLADMRKELKDLRKKAMPTPVSRMKKSECAAELARLKGSHVEEVKEVKEVLAKAEVPKKTAKKVEAVQKVEHKKQEAAVKKTKGVKEASAEVKVPTTKDKPKKESKAGSEEMKERMAKLRAMRKKKDE